MQFKVSVKQCLRNRNSYLSLGWYLILSTAIFYLVVFGPFVVCTREGNTLKRSSNFSIRDDNKRNRMTDYSPEQGSHALQLDKETVLGEMTPTNPRSAGSTELQTEFNRLLSYSIEKSEQEKEEMEREVASLFDFLEFPPSSQPPNSTVGEVFTAQEQVLNTSLDEFFEDIGEDEFVELEDISLATDPFCQSDNSISNEQIEKDSSSSSSSDNSIFQNELILELEEYLSSLHNCPQSDNSVTDHALAIVSQEQLIFNPIEGTVKTVENDFDTEVSVELEFFNGYLLIPIQPYTGNIPQTSQNSIQLDNLPPSNENLPSTSNNSHFSNTNLSKNSIILNETLQLYSSTEVKPFKNNENQWCIECEYGILSFSPNATASKIYRKENFILSDSLFIYFGTDDFENVLLFKHACNMVNLLNVRKHKSVNDSKFEIIQTIYQMFQIYHSIRDEFKPYYYSFINSTENHWKKIFNANVPFYFFFTSVYYLMNNELFFNNEYLVSLLNKVYQKIMTGTSNSQKCWSFLSKYEKRFGLQSVKFIHGSKLIYFDIHTISFIYTEMKSFHSHEKQEFFTKVWHHCKNTKHTRLGIWANNEMSFLVADKSEKVIDNFEKQARKLYQHKFTELLFEEWLSLEELFIQYEALQSAFYSIAIDFRLRIFNRRDFRRLNAVMVKIVSKLHSHKTPMNRKFFIELEYFFYSKSLVFLYDFYRELYRKDAWNFKDYKETLQNIKEIYNNFQKIRTFLKERKIEIAKINLEYTGLICDNQFFNLIGLVDKLIPFAKQNIFNYVLFCPAIPTDLRNCFCKFDYFKSDLKYLPQELRFKSVEFIAKLEEVLITSDKECNEIFERHRYEIFRKMWSIKSEDFSKISINDKRKFLKNAKKFLILTVQ